LSISKSIRTLFILWITKHPKEGSNKFIFYYFEKNSKSRGNTITKDVPLGKPQIPYINVIHMKKLSLCNENQRIDLNQGGGLHMG